MSEAIGSSSICRITMGAGSPMVTPSAATASSSDSSFDVDENNRKAARNTRGATAR